MSCNSEEYVTVDRAQIKRLVKEIDPQRFSEIEAFSLYPWLVFVDPGLISFRTGLINEGDLDHIVRGFVMLYNTYHFNMHSHHIQCPLIVTHPKPRAGCTARRLVHMKLVHAASKTIVDSYLQDAVITRAKDRTLNTVRMSSKPKSMSRGANVDNNITVDEVPSLQKKKRLYISAW
ncbi:hypothetical protein VNO77_44746 [Canavalia gladiata]|uniref:Uncharacterized protein n=1 Tax=Canavalia gladiata TaxID=3824 RepID=A0AAN9JXK2_CANGL